MGPMLSSKTGILSTITANSTAPEAKLSLTEAKLSLTEAKLNSPEAMLLLGEGYSPGMGALFYLKGACFGEVGLLKGHFLSLLAIGA